MPVNRPITGLGYGQSWVNMSASRASGVTYYNETGKPISISVFNSSGTSMTLSGYADGEFMSYIAMNSGLGTVGNLTYPIKAGGSYKVVYTSSPINQWWELR